MGSQMVANADLILGEQVRLGLALTSKFCESHVIYNSYDGRIRHVMRVDARGVLCFFFGLQT
jgi:hypothetical protein